MTIIPSAHCVRGMLMQNSSMGNVEARVPMNHNGILEKRPSKKLPQIADKNIAGTISIFRSISQLPV
jgi:hypothetical protein